MKRCGELLVLFALALAPASLVAVDIVECEDERGSRSFRASCPPGSVQVGSKQIKLKPPAAGNSIKAVIYTGPDCEACGAVTKYLGNRGVAYEEKNVEGDVDLQAELMQLTGELRVPTTLIGNEKLVGYNPVRLGRALEAAGHSEKNTEEEETAEETPPEVREQEEQETR